MSYKSIKTASLLKDSDDQRTNQRKKNMLLIVLQYLHDEGYINSAETLGKETNLNLSKYEVCDNINLETILMDFEAYYHVKFNRYPKISKKIDLPDVSIRPHGNSCPAKRVSNFVKDSNKHNGDGKIDATLPRINSYNCKKVSHSNLDDFQNLNQLKVKPTMSSSTNGNSQENLNNNYESNKLLPIVGQPLLNGKTFVNDKTEGVDCKQILHSTMKINQCSNYNDNVEDRLLKPLGGYIGYSSEWKELAQVVSRDIYLQNPNVNWTDIIGLENAKNIVKESVVYPIKFPQFFTGILSPWKGLLLYGPPGTGKTLLAKAIATECKTTFFNISASTIVSKWRGDSEKLVRVLFELARFHAPSTIFLDEIDALMGERGGPNGEHEGSRRMKTELLVQMDGLAKSNDLVFLLAASNLPWELDHALLRRLEKRILIGLPNLEARKSMFEHHLPPVVCPEDNNRTKLLADLNYNDLASLTDGYSGSDIYVVCKEAAMRPLRKVFSILENSKIEDELHISLETITTSDVKWVLSRTKPSANKLLGKFLKWQSEYESS
ncbi:hypothetical protein HELRODRAFT_63272 [Helobdella robusta]|uniref:Katanin p60 ATPase-containing subunit A-like 2 n=1 Tax=Helobdella robusta TaxID=6412 RepID=T1FXD4_HELRO|nr:hypothetical protein HELRODRAFT_63272 [Helobdella robusta]ESO12368.1 hypothetical protein HELRODRAFT_63272 [Helobdella robusta]